MPALSPKRFRTLAEANQYYSQWQQSSSLPAGNPVPKLPERPPTADPSVPPPKAPGEPAFDLAAMSPKQFSEMLERTDDKTLLALLSRETGRIAKEQNPALVARLYREICRRRKT
jgi:hypothetical protein